MEDKELIDRAVARVAHIKNIRPAARELGVSPQSLKEWRKGKRTPMREPTRNKLLSKLSGNAGRESNGKNGATEIPPTSLRELLAEEIQTARIRAEALRFEASAADRRAAAVHAAELAALYRSGIFTGGAKAGGPEEVVRKMYADLDRAGIPRPTPASPEEPTIKPPEVGPG